LSLRGSARSDRAGYRQAFQGSALFASPTLVPGSRVVADGARPDTPLNGSEEDRC
jgi:hypothetical protein